LRGSVGRFQEECKRYLGSLGMRMVPLEADINRGRRLGTEIGDNLPQMGEPGLHSTHCCGAGTSSHNWCRFCHGNAQHSRLADVHSARAR
jgi:hypothetical protein